MYIILYISYTEDIVRGRYVTPTSCMYIYDTTDSSHRCCKLRVNVYIIITIATTSPIPCSPFAPFIISFPDIDCNSNLVSIPPKYMCI